MKGISELSKLIAVSHAVLPDEGEDSFALYADEEYACLCAADGCGGLGSRRYEALENRTGAYIAARLVTDAVIRWSRECSPMPATLDEGAKLCRELESDLHEMLLSFAEKNCREQTSRIVGSMQRRLPSTLCAAFSRIGAAGWREVCFLWCGDSRGYVLDAEGLHQCTADHLRGNPDALESLYRDVPLSRMLSADKMGEINLHRLRANLPGAVIVATDGAFSSCLSPMEFEKLLIDTLLSAKNWDSWQRKLNNLIGKMAQDDATLLIQPVGAEDIEALKEIMIPRREVLQKQFITPVRRHRREMEYIRAKWREYCKTYDWTEGGRHERMDWRV